MQPSFNSEGFGSPNCVAYPTLRDLFAESAGGNGSVTADQIAEHILKSYPDWAREQAVNGLSAKTLERIFEIQARLIVNESGNIVAVHSREMGMLTDYSHGTYCRALQRSRLY